MKTNNRNIFLPIITIVVCSYFPFSLFSQNTFDTIFDLSLYDHRAHRIAETPDKNYIVAVNFNNFSAAPICKVDSTGVLLWTKYYSLDDITNICDLEVNENGNIFIIGHCSNSGVYDRSYLMKLNSDGDSLWSKKYFYGHDTFFRYFTSGFNNHLTIICDINYPAYSWTMKLISIDTTGEILWESIVIENDTSYNYSTFGLL
ncbi:MAG: hypothetical protein PHQ65_15320, partial [Bacteroidales bacterium]|nr:hypothetical protein [Bacteroidales bacterium]MDD3666636.1 hypothetical protein [Bacteroidales bacterium]